MIEGGYYIKARCIQTSEISTAPPYVREIWDWLLMEANHTDKKYAGFDVKRGQLFRTYNAIREGLSWQVGWRKMMYNENQTKKAMKFLREARMIDTRKELGGVLVTICNYDYYQDPKNYERTTKDPIERTIEEPLPNHPLPYNNKNEKNVNILFVEFWNLYDKKIGSKKKCEKKWLSLSDEQRSKIISGLPAWKKTITEKKYQPHPLTYLNNERWEDEITVTDEVVDRSGVTFEIGETDALFTK